MLREHKTVFAYTRALGGVRALVVMNFGTEETVVHFDTAICEEMGAAKLVLTNYPRPPEPISERRLDDTGSMKLVGYEGLVYLGGL